MVFKRRRRSMGETTLADLLRRLPELDADATIYAAEPWDAASRATLHVQDVENGDGDMRVGDLKYFLEVDIAQDAARVCEEWRRQEGLRTSEPDRFRAVVHYAINDAFLPVHVKPPLPAAQRNGFSLMVTRLEVDKQGGFAEITAPDGSRAQIVWDSAPARFEQRAVPPPGTRSWGLYGVARPLPLTTDEEASRYLEALEEDLRGEWDRWREAQGGT